MKFLDLFAGIGGFRLGMEQAGHECIGFCEIDKYARKSYKAIHNTEKEVEWHDITTVSDNDFRSLRGQVDIICGGFPCQAFSVAGKRGGFSDTRGTLFFHIARAAEQIQPRFLFLENVRGLLSHDKGTTFATILTTLDELGYDAEWQICNSKDFGVPQNRERVFIIGHLRNECGRKVFPVGRKNESTINTIGHINPNGFRQINEVLGVDGISTALRTFQGGGLQPKILDDQGRAKKKVKPKDYAPTLRRESHGNDPKVVTPVLTPERMEKRQNGRRFKNNNEPSFTLTSQDRHGVMVAGNVNPSGKGMNGQVYKNGGLSPTLTTNKEEGPKIQESYRIRKLTPKECFRLQGFPDWAFDKAAEVNSDSQLYKQAGNSVTVNVIYEIAKKMELVT